ncbi:MAG: hypothetical protein LUE22_05005 [Oscillospiraceae bacterium]|nr:hypothetical protein [Oscillospiraceae bacterium]
MELRRNFIAAALFLAASFVKWAPDFEELVAPELRELLDREQVALYLPVEAVSWLGLD